MRTPRYKRPFDLSILAVAHVALAPVWALLWIVIPAVIYVTDRGPVFYGQDRVGKDGRKFRTLKFRTMVVNADRMGNPWTSANDPRVTSIGRLLRKTALDELPQLISILKGDMSLVGPRALDTREHEALARAVPGFERRLAITPGLTGLAQVYDKTDNAVTKLNLDLQYAARMSPWTDMNLIFRSITNSLSGRWDRRSGKRDMPDVSDG